MKTLLSKLWLIVEDDNGHFVLLQRLCQRLRPTPNVLRFTDGLDARHFLLGRAVPGEREPNQLPGLILSDLRMPLFDGFDLLKWTKEQAPPLSGIPSVIVSTSDHPHDRERARRLGAYAYLEKPPNTAALLDVLRPLSAAT